LQKEAALWDKTVNFGQGRKRPIMVYILKLGKQEALSTIPRRSSSRLETLFRKQPTITGFGAIRENLKKFIA
jgi:hypothetical protein